MRRDVAGLKPTSQRRDVGHPVLWGFGLCVNAVECDEEEVDGEGHPEGEEDVGDVEASVKVRADACGDGEEDSGAGDDVEFRDEFELTGEGEVKEGEGEGEDEANESLGEDVESHDSGEGEAG